MSFSKAVDLIRLARMAAAHRNGVTLDDVCDEFGVSHRTAQRMTAALESVFSNVKWKDGYDRRRRWRLNDPVLVQLQLRHEGAIEALEIAAGAARAKGRSRHATALSRLHDDLLARLDEKDALRTEADAEAVLSVIGRVARPGPKTPYPTMLVDTLIEALRGPFRIRIRYGTPDADERIIEPHGLLFGGRGYLVAREIGGEGQIRKLRLDRIHAPVLIDESFPFEEGFSLEAYAAQAFGVFSDPTQYGEVIWRFETEAADRAAQFSFHPHQKLEYQQDGGLIVRFYASGWTEMAWHLYQWGDKVEVIAPDGLRDMVAGYRRSDFSTLP